MAFSKKLSSTVFNTPHVSYKNMTLFSYNTDGFPPLNIRLHTRKALRSLYVLLKCICLLLNQMIFSGLILGLLFCHVNFLFVQHLVHRIACFSPVSPIAVGNCKNIGNRSIRCNSVRSSSSNVDRVSKPV